MMNMLRGKNGILILLCVFFILLETNNMLKHNFFQRVYLKYRGTSFLMNYQADNRKKSTFVDSSSFRHTTGNENFTKKILLINKPVWLNENYLNLYLAQQCPFKNCVMTTDSNNIKNMAAIVFSTQDPFDIKPPISAANRQSEQVWIFLRMEPPEIKTPDWYRHLIWKNTMNWSWGYRLDSDIFFPYQTFLKRDETKLQNYNEIFKNKSHHTAWVVSRCPTQSRRDEYVKLLQREGVSVDVFGKCSKSKHKKPWGEIASLINRKYKFYLAFESSICKDYITEKFFKYFGLNTLIIVRGGVNYSEYFDVSTFIDSADFSSVRDLAKYILNLGQNEAKYTKILQDKDAYVPTTIFVEMAKSSCVLCKKLNNLEQNKKIYENIESYIHDGTCFEPTDIH